jgi:hypothetical protein
MQLVVVSVTQTLASSLLFAFLNPEPVCLRTTKLEPLLIHEHRAKVVKSNGANLKIDLSTCFTHCKQLCKTCAKLSSNLQAVSADLLQRHLTSMNLLLLEVFLFTSKPSQHHTWIVLSSFHF